MVCAGIGVRGIFTGLETLRIKETDRIAALQNELEKVGVTFSNISHLTTKNPEKEFFQINGKMQINQPLFQTYEDHRMAMAFAPLAMFGEILIDDPFVVAKSYPDFWKDLEKLGFEIEEEN